METGSEHVDLVATKAKRRPNTFADPILLRRQLSRLSEEGPRI